jgi:hypothetical protein
LHPLRRLIHFPAMDSFGKPKKIKTGRRYLINTIMAVVVAMAVGELILRDCVGLGDTPVMMSDPLTFYRFAPSQTVNRFHHLMHYNAFSMRSDDCTSKKSDPNELRVIVIGDSVINGGSLTDQSELATAILQNKLRTDLGRPIMVGNASAPGWGPPEEWGWVQEFGLLDADIVILEFISYDDANVPKSVCVPPDMPSRRPALAWIDLFGRYILPRLFHTVLAAEPIPAGKEDAIQPDINWCTWSIQQIIRKAHAQGAKVILAQQFEQEELDAGVKQGHGLILATAEGEHVDAVVQFGPAFAKVLASGLKPYRSNDNIHPSAVGQQVVAEELLPVIEHLLPGPTRAATISPAISR